MLRAIKSKLYPKKKKLLEKKTAILQKRVNGVQRETQFLKTMNLALVKNKESWIQKLKDTEEESHIISPKDIKIKELETKVQELMLILEQDGIQQEEEAYPTLLSHTDSLDTEKK